MERFLSVVIISLIMKRIQSLCPVKSKESLPFIYKFPLFSFSIMSISGTVHAELYPVTAFHLERQIVPGSRNSVKSIPPKRKGS